MAQVDFHWEILTTDQRAVLPALAFLRDSGMYLAGGTALAMHLGHRQSLDFDFFTEQEFNSDTVLATLQKSFPDLSVIQRAKNTLYVVLRGITTSMFTYRYPLVAPCVSADNVCLATLEDIAAMKVQAIIQRGTKRDFVDMFVLLQQLNLEQVMLASAAKYGPAHNPYLILQALTYFVDADAEPLAGRNVMLSSFNWPQVKSHIIAAANTYRQKHV